MMMISWQQQLRQQGLAAAVKDDDESDDNDNGDATKAIETFEWNDSLKLSITSSSQLVSMNLLLKSQSDYYLI